MPILFSAAAGFFLNLIVIPLVILVSRRRGWFDEPGTRKVHSVPVSRLGGVGIYMSVAVSIIAAAIAFPALNLHTLLPLTGGSSLAFLLGLSDDFRDIPARVKLMLQTAAGAVLVVGGHTAAGFPLPAFTGHLYVSFGVLAFPVTVFVYIAVANAVNLSDGIDGLAGGSNALTALWIGALQLSLGNIAGAVVAAAVFGAVVGFLVFNRPPARIFMGDSGSLFLGILLSGLLLLPPAGAAHSPELSSLLLLALLTLYMLPLLDTLAAVIRRLRAGVPIFTPDRKHLHHKLLDMGYTVPQILAFIYSFMVVSGAAAGMLYASRRYPELLPNSAGVAAVLAVWTAGAVFFLWIHVRNQIRIRS